MSKDPDEERSMNVLSDGALANAMMNSVKRFVYLDDDGNVQGPYEGATLLAWHAAGMMSEDTKLRAAALPRTTRPFQIWGRWQAER